MTGAVAVRAARSILRMVMRRPDGNAMALRATLASPDRTAVARALKVSMSTLDRLRHDVSRRFPRYGKPKKHQ